MKHKIFGFISILLSLGACSNDSYKEPRLLSGLTKQENKDSSETKKEYATNEMKFFVKDTIETKVGEYHIWKKITYVPKFEVDSDTKLPISEEGISYDLEQVIFIEGPETNILKTYSVHTDHREHPIAKLVDEKLTPKVVSNLKKEILTKETITNKYVVDIDRMILNKRRHFFYSLRMCNKASHVEALVKQVETSDNTVSAILVDGKGFLPNVQNFHPIFDFNYQTGELLGVHFAPSMNSLNDYIAIRKSEVIGSDSEATRVKSVRYISTDFRLGQTELNSNLYNLIDAHRVSCLRFYSINDIQAKEEIFDTYYMYNLNSKVEQLVIDTRYVENEVRSAYERAKKLTDQKSRSSYVHVYSEDQIFRSFIDSQWKSNAIDGHSDLWNRIKPN